MGWFDVQSETVTTKSGRKQHHTKSAVRRRRASTRKRWLKRLGALALLGVAAKTLHAHKPANVLQKANGVEAHDSNGALHDSDGALHDSDGALHDSDGALHDSDGDRHNLLNDSSATSRAKKHKSFYKRYKHAAKTVGATVVGATVGATVGAVGLGYLKHAMDNRKGNREFAERMANRLNFEENNKMLSWLQEKIRNEEQYQARLQGLTTQPYLESTPYDTSPVDNVNALLSMIEAKKFRSKL